jgi:hypothetical protein
LLAGALGAVVGTLGGASIRGRLAQAFGKDLPAGAARRRCGNRDIHCCSIEVLNGTG